MISATGICGSRATSLSQTGVRPCEVSGLAGEGASQAQQTQQAERGVALVGSFHSSPNEQMTMSMRSSLVPILLRRGRCLQKVHQAEAALTDGGVDGEAVDDRDDAEDGML
eukprot:6012377-Prymnesium_polylepis.1